MGEVSNLSEETGRSRIDFLRGNRGGMPGKSHDPRSGDLDGPQVDRLRTDHYKGDRSMGGSIEGPAGLTVLKMAKTG